MTTTRRVRTMVARLAAVVLVLLLGGAVLNAQPPQQQQQQQKEPKEPPKKADTRAKRGGKPAARTPEKQAPKAEERSPRAGRPQEPPAKAQEQGREATPSRQAPPPTVVRQPGRAASPRTGARPTQRPVTRPAHVSTTREGATVVRDRGGRVSEVRTRSGVVVYHAPDGIRRIETERPGNRVVVAEGRNRGYVQRPVIVRDHEFFKRTYYVGGRPFVRLYRPVRYHNAIFHVYMPVRYYHPTFYAYVLNPWPVVVTWNWGWAERPWYGYYGGYFRPYIRYSSPFLWLTDFFMGATLQAAYENRLAAGMVVASPMAGPDDTLSPEVRQLIADEVRRQIAQERAEEQSGWATDVGDQVPAWADGNSHVFVAYRPLGVTSNHGYCTVGEGDVLQMTAPPPSWAGAANVMVLASRPANCRPGSVVMVSLQDLQDMSNWMRETVESGMTDLQANQGQAGIPPLPPGAVGRIDTPLAAEAMPDADANSQLTQVYDEADPIDRAAVGQVGDSAAGTPTVSLGMTFDQVRAALGPPQQVMDAGTKQIYIYPSVKITFLDGRVSDIE